MIKSCVKQWLNDPCKNRINEIKIACVCIGHTNLSHGRSLEYTFGEYQKNSKYFILKT